MLRTIRAIGLAALLLATTGLPAVAQDADEAWCNGLMDYLASAYSVEFRGSAADIVRKGCVEYRRASDREDSTAEPPTVEVPPSDVDGPGLGATQSTGRLLVTLIDFDWDVSSWVGAPEGHEQVAALLEFESVSPDAYVGVFGFRVYDRDGFAYDGSTYFGSTPRLDGGDLREGRKRKGWVTFEAPKGADLLQVEYEPRSRNEDGPLQWTVER